MIDPKLSAMRQAFPDLSEQEILEILAEENQRVAEMERESENRKKDELKRRAKKRAMLLSITEMGRKTPASEEFKNRLESLKEQARISRSMLRNIGEAITPVSSLVCPDPAPAGVAADTVPVDCRAAEFAPVDPVSVPSLVCPDPVPVVPADSFPADPAVVPVGFVPVGFVPAVIQGTLAEIQGSVRDSKRETTLTEQKKTNEILESRLNRLIELQEKNIEASTQTAQNSWTIAETSQKTAALLEQRIKPNTDLRERAAAFKQLKNKYPKIMQCRAEFWVQYCSPIGLDWKGVYEAENGRPCDLTGDDLESERNKYEKSIREYRKDDYDKFKKQKKQE